MRSAEAKGLQTINRTVKEKENVILKFIQDHKGTLICSKIGSHSCFPDANLLLEELVLKMARSSRKCKWCLSFSSAN